MLQLQLLLFQPEYPSSPPSLSMYSSPQTDLNVANSSTHSRPAELARHCHHIPVQSEQPSNLPVEYSVVRHVVVTFRAVVFIICLTSVVAGMMGFHSSWHRWRRWYVSPGRRDMCPFVVTNHFTLSVVRGRSHIASSRHSWGHYLLDGIIMLTSRGVCTCSWSVPIADNSTTIIHLA